MTFRLNNGFGTTTTPTGGNITDWSAIRDRPDFYPPEDHSHPQSEIVGLAEALAGKQPLTEFKTVGGQEIIGGGNIEFPPGFEETAEELRLQIEGLAERVEDLEARLIVTSPLAFAGGQWAADTGPGPALINIDIIDLPANGGSPITGIEYTFASGSSASGIPLSGTAPGIRTVEAAANSTLYSVRIRALNDAGAGPWSTVKTATSGAPASVAPTVITPPTLAGDTTVGSILGGSIGSAVGNPTPTAAISYERNGQPIPNQNGNTLPTTGFAAEDEIVKIVVWSSVINGETVTAEARSDPWVLTIQPTITAEPFTLTAGQPTTISFNTTPDTVTVAQGSTTLTATRVGTTNDWTVIPATTEPVSIGATKAGWTAYSATITPAGALPDIIKTPTNTLQLVNVDENTLPFDLTMAGRYAGTRTVTPAAMADGPVFHVAPSQSGTAAVGEELTLDPGVVLNFASAGTAIVSYTLLVDGTERPVNGPTYTVQSGDEGKSLAWELAAEDGNGLRTFTTNAIAIPAGGAQWWDERALIDVDLAGNRARIDGVTYASIAAAKTANAIKTSGSGVDYIDVSGLGTSVALAATGVTPPTAGNYSMIAMDDGDDGTPADEYIQIGVASGPRAAFSCIIGGSAMFSPTTTATTPVSTPLRLAMRAKASGVLDSCRGSVNGTKVASGQNGAVTLPAVTRLCIGNRSANDRAWVAAGGTLSRLILINADLSDSAIDALLA